MIRRLFRVLRVLDGLNVPMLKQGSVGCTEDPRLMGCYGINEPHKPWDSWDTATQTYRPVTGQPEGNVVLLSKSSTSGVLSQDVSNHVGHELQCSFAKGTMHICTWYVYLYSIYLHVYIYINHI